MLDAGITTKETTVWKQTAFLNKGLLAKNKFFDLLELNGLYIFNVGGILKEWRNKTNALQCDLNRLMNTNKDYFGLVERDKRGLPLKMLFELGKKLEVVKTKECFYELLQNRDLLFGHIGKSNRIKLPTLQESREILANICLPDKYPFLTSVKKGSSGRGWLQDKFLLKIVKKDYDGCERHYIRSLTFNSFLRKFFKFEKNCKLNFPLTKYVDERKNKIDLISGIIIPLLQSDGCPWTFTNKCKELHDIIVDAFYYAYGVLPSSYMIKAKDKSAFNTTFPNIDKKIKEQLLALSGNVKTTPAVKQKKSDFLKERQPHLNYLLNADRKTQIAGLQMYFAAEGWSQFYETHSGYVAPLLGIACSHPTLHFGLIDLCNKFNAKMISIKNKNYWSGFDSIITSGLIQTINLLKIEPFIDGVYVLRGNFKNYLKKEALLGILEYRHREKQKIVENSLPREVKINNIKKIIDSKEFKDEAHYIKLFERGEL